MKISFKCSVAHQLLLKFTKSWTVFEPHSPQLIWTCSSIYNQMAYVIAKNDFDGLHQLIVRFFLCPQLIWILFVFLLRVHCIAPRWSTFQGVSRRVDVISTRDFANSVNVLESNLIFQRLCLFKSNCWNEIREMSVFESFFFLNQVSSVKDPTHPIQCSPLIVLYFENKKWPVVRLKWLFSWFFVSVLIFDLGYTFQWSTMRWPFVNFKKTQGSSQNLRIHQERLFSFFSTNFISMHNNQ